jgi:hypothetical protein
MDIRRQDEELVALARARGLKYPIETRSQFVAQMVAPGRPVIFRGVAYEAEFASSLIPEFFFPIASEQDLVSKALELLMARGLLPLQRLPGTRE